MEFKLKRFVKIIFTLTSLLFFTLFFSSSNVLADSHDEEAFFQRNVRAGSDMSFSFQEIDIRTLLQLIAKHSGMNFIISDAVKGTASLNLKNVTWRQALKIVMQTHGLTSRQVGSVLYISTIEDITSTESKQLLSNQELSNLAPLQSMIIQLKYANANDLAEFLKGKTGTLMTTRGQIAVDSRTNSIVVRDTRANLIEIRPAIKRLDVPAKQVLIEARIVSIDTSYEEQLGIKFGLSKTDHITGTFDAANALQNGTPLAKITPPESRLNFNNPASSVNGAIPGSIGMALAKIGALYLDLELSAIEEEGHGQVIASPHVITSNQKKATIQTGEEIPYQEATSSGATSISFKKAVLSLEIIPQITPNNKIILHLKATEDSRGPQLVVSPGSQSTGANGAVVNTPPVLGPPVIDSQEVESNVLLNNNETIVIGGIYKQTKQNTVDRIPFFGSLPIIGYLFRHTGIINDRNELLIFVTPKIINAFAPRVAELKQNHPVIYKN